MMREPIPATPRKAMTPARRKRVLDRYEGRCAYPCCEVTEALEIDHEIALELGGKDEDSNLKPLCAPHHKAKTARDLKLITKMRRRQKSSGFRPVTAKPKRKIQSRGFDKGHRPIPSRPFEKRVAR